MMLSRYNLKKIDLPGLVLPREDAFELPERVLQFGSGALLRALPDYFIDKANREGKFNGRVVVVKSTDVGSSADFEKQDGLYTLYLKGVKDQKEVNEQIICSAISRVLSATTDWISILDVSRNPELKVIISNTTKIGILLIKDDISRHPPLSFPGKLLAVLYERYKFFAGSEESGVVIIATELIANNGKKLESIVLELAHLNHLEPAFMDWLENCNCFCNSLVDRIVPGKPGENLNAKFEKESGYKDDLRIVSEAYCLWAIEGNDKIKKVLSFAGANPGVIISPDIERFRELKLRLFNGTHTLCCAVAILSGFKTVKDAMDNKAFSHFINWLMLDEIAPAISCNLDDIVMADFAGKVLDRFRNPDIQREWLGISIQYSNKLKIRALPLLLNHYVNDDKPPECLAFCFAAFIRFMKVTTDTEGKFRGHANGFEYLVNDSHAQIFSQIWETKDTKIVVQRILGNVGIWGTNLNKLNGFSDAVLNNLNAMMEKSPLQLLETKD